MSKKVLVLYSEFGYGHLSVAKSLEENMNMETYLHNCKKEASPMTTKLIEKVYSNFFTKNASNILISNFYGFLFWSGNAILPVRTYGVQKTGAKAVNKLINRYNPDLIICTYPYKIKTDIPIITIITDYGYTKSWKSNKKENYFVAHNTVKSKLMKQKVDKHNINITGIPVSKKFDLENNSNQVKTVLFNLGARGQFKFINMVNIIEDLKEENLNIIIVCGKNKDLYNNLNMKYKNKPSIDIYPFVNNLEQILNKSDLVVTKAGGISISECIYAQTPMIINQTQSLKGQEAFNLRFIKENGLGLTTKENSIAQAIRSISTNNDLYTGVKDNVVKLKNQYKETNFEQLINQVIEKG